MEGEAEFRAATRKERLCFAAECGLGRLGHTRTPDGLEQPHEKNGPVLPQNVAPTPFGHTRALEGPFFDPRLSSVCFKVREYNMSYYIASTGV